MERKVSKGQFCVAIQFSALENSHANPCCSGLGRTPSESWCRLFSVAVVPRCFGAAPPECVGIVLSWSWCSMLPRLGAYLSSMHHWSCRILFGSCVQSDRGIMFESFLLDYRCGDVADYIAGDVCRLLQCYRNSTSQLSSLMIVWSSCVVPGFECLLMKLVLFRLGVCVCC